MIRRMHRVNCRLLQIKYFIHDLYIDVWLIIVKLFINKQAYVERRHGFKCNICGISYGGRK